MQGKLRKDRKETNITGDTKKKVEVAGESQSRRKINTKGGESLHCT